MTLIGLASYGILASTVAAQAWQPQPQPQQVLTASTTTHFDWASVGTELIPPNVTEQRARADDCQIEPSRHLRYTACYDGLQCARLDVPLNHNTTDQTERAAVAVARLPAKVPVTDSRYGGAIVINPGGPGESGIDELITRGRDIQTIVDAPGSAAKNHTHKGTGVFFDIIGFDPRGVKNTSPSLRCFPNAFNQQIWLLGYQDYSLVWESDASIGLEFARTRALARNCAEVDKADIIRYVNTAQVVEDMLSIVERHGEWREAEAARLLSIRVLDEEQRQVKQRISWKQGQEMLQHWGESYGTLLGQTFAAMHPNRVGRLVIDGVLDPDDYYSGNWLANLQDSDQFLKLLSKYCFDAGPSRCPVYTGKSASDVETYVEDFIFGFKTSPMAVSDETLSVHGPQVVAYRDVYLRAVGAMHSPFASAESFFQLVAELSQGNFSRIASEKASQQEMTASLAKCNDNRLAPSGCFPEQYFGLLSATPVIECMDSASSGNRNLTPSHFKSYYKTLTEQSKWFAASWARHKLSCVDMVDEPAWQFQGPIAGNTSHGLLIISNTADTVTPIGNGRRAATLFPGSKVLQQNTGGHCSHAHPSMCTAKHVREYFQTGKLPMTGTICEPDLIPFVDDLDGLRTLDEDDSELWEALNRLSMPSRPFHSTPGV